MQHIRPALEAYVRLLEERARQPQVSRSYQLTGLAIAELLGDLDRKSLYIKLAKTHDPSALLALAKRIAENATIRKKGAYFMKLVTLARRAGTDAPP